MAKNEEFKPFQLVAGNAALDLVNTLDNRPRETGADELLRSYEDMRRFVTESGLLKWAPAPATWKVAERNRVVSQVKELREALASIIYARIENQPVRAAALSQLESHFKRAAAIRKLAAEADGLRWRWPGAANVAAPLWLLEQAAADLMLSDRAALIRACANDTCQWLFLDTSKNHTRRWCDMKLCGNRIKARNFQARLAGKGTASPHTA